MLGLQKENGVYRFKAAVRTEQLYLNLYEGGRRVRQIPFDPGQRTGDVWRLSVTEEIGGYDYAYEADGRVFTDPNGTVFDGRPHFGQLRDGTRILKTPVREAVEPLPCPEAWSKDRPLEIPYEDSIIYRIHVRGFTEHKSSGLAKEIRGSFRGITEKIPYLKALGVTAVELMPPYEFNEVMLPPGADSTPELPPAFRGRQTGPAAAGRDAQGPADRGQGTAEAGAGADSSAKNGGAEPAQAEPDGPRRAHVRPTGRINYWGFTADALHLAPKKSFTAEGDNPRNEFRELVLRLHEAGIEIIVDLYFTEDASPYFILRVLHYWRIQYHVDGIHLIGPAPLGVIARDPYLSRFKLWADSWDGCRTEKRSGTAGNAGTAQRWFADYNDGFQNDMRRILKGDEGMVSTLMQRIREHPDDRASIHYMANAGGLSLADALTYDRKHNEDNGEDNRDGTDMNYSWNCGVEGPSRKKGVLELRRRMFRNACVLLLLSQGTPLLSMGDEAGHTRRGNNNAYCQDNALNWVDWTLPGKNHAFYEFMKFMIAFRKKHGVFRQPEALRGLDYRNAGIPDISFHGENAWRPDLEHYRRQLGVLYAGRYADDDTFLVLYNFHWEPHRFALPHPPLGWKWEAVIDTADDEVNGIIKEGQAPSEENEKNFRTVESRSIVVLQAVEDQEYKKKQRRRKRTAAAGQPEPRKQLKQAEQPEQVAQAEMPGKEAAPEGRKA